MERRIYRERSLSGITQGSIITGLELHRYSHFPVWGLVITPRCDLARGISVETVHVLPVVDLEAWYEIEGKCLLVDKYRAKLKEKINRKVPEDLSKGDIFESGFSNIELKEIFNGLADINRRSELVSLIEMLDKEDSELLSLSSKTDSINSLINNLFSDKEKRFYLIEDWNNPNSSKVILLREILSISRELARKYQDGFTEKDYSESLLNSNNLRTSKAQTMTYEIQIEILSPFIEHIMQRFAYNFTRIGVTDRTSSIIDQIKIKITKKS